MCDNSGYGGAKSSQPIMSADRAPAGFDASIPYGGYGSFNAVPQQYRYGPQGAQAPKWAGSRMMFSRFGQPQVDPRPMIGPKVEMSAPEYRPGTSKVEMSAPEMIPQMGAPQMSTPDAMPQQAPQVNTPTTAGSWGIVPTDDFKGWRQSTPEDERRNIWGNPYVRDALLHNPSADPAQLFPQWASLFQNNPYRPY